MSKTSLQSELPANVSLLLGECNRLRGEGQPDFALRLLETACASDAIPAGSASAYAPGERIDLLIARAGVLCDLNRVEEAVAVSKEARNADSAHCGAHFGLCFTLYLAERWNEALAELEVLVAAAPAHPNAAWLRAGLVRRLRGDYDLTVLDAYALVLTVDAGNAYAHIERADVLRAWGRYEEARDVYARFQSPLHCDDETLRVEAAFKRGCVALTLQSELEARDAFQFALNIAPDYPDAREMLALACANL